MFNRRDLTFEPEMNIATPQSYVLGPMDVVNIDVWELPVTISVPSSLLMVPLP